MSEMKNNFSMEFLQKNGNSISPSTELSILIQNLNSFLFINFYFHSKYQNLSKI
jgi:hypothetical protein